MNEADLKTGIKYRFISGKYKGFLAKIHEFYWHKPPAYRDLRYEVVSGTSSGAVHTEPMSTFARSVEKTKS